jgi:hypothetical protein
MRQDRITLYPVGREARYPDLSCTGEGEAQQGRDPSERAGGLLPWMTTVTRLSWLTSAVIGRGRSQRWTQHGAGGNDTGREIAPQRHHQLARQGDDGNAPDASLEIAHPLAEPARQRTVGLVDRP